MNAKPRAVGRFAPTPSGRMHLRNIFTALAAYASAAQKGGELLLRIEDIDRERCPADATALLFDDLGFFGIPFSGEILYQSERDSFYKRELAKLQARGLVYPCYCSRAELHAATAPHGDTPVYSRKCRALPPDKRPSRPAALRLIVPHERITFADLCGITYSQVLDEECGDFIVRRSDGKFAYQLAAPVDDALSGVTEVVRGCDLISSAPRQIYLLRLLGYDPPAYCHLPLVTTPDGERLSKSAGKYGIDALRKRFGAPEPIIGALAFAAGLTDRNEPLTLAEFVRVFDPLRLPRGSFPLPATLFPD